MIVTDRIILRDWRDGDRAALAAINRDPDVMTYLGKPLSREDSDAGIDRLRGYTASHDYTFWAVERRADGVLLGFCGLKPGPADTPLHGQVEIGWRLARHAWGQGYALEAAAASLADAWVRELPRVLAMTVDANTASWGLMVRLGMTRRPDLDFNHPALPAGDPLRRHIVYAIERPD